MDDATHRRFLSDHGDALDRAQQTALNTAGFVAEDGTRCVYTSALSDDALFCYTLLMVDRHGIRSEHGKAFLVAFYQGFGVPWGYTRESKAIWVPRYERGLDELHALGVVDEVRRTSTGGKVAEGFHPERVVQGQIELKEG